MTVAAVFTALALAIPLFFQGTLQIFIPTIGYSATLASHVPVMLSTLFGPIVSTIVASAAAIGFTATLGPIVGARAATHIIWGIATAIALKKGMSFSKALFIIALPMHALLEGAVVLIIVPWEAALLTVAGTAIHHTIDAIIAIVILKAAQPLIKTIKTKQQKQTPN